jgi:hypothetical protein
MALRALGVGRDLDFTDEYDDALAMAVLAFQTRHEHSTKDGNFGKGTRRLLVNVLLQQVGERVFERMEDPTEGARELKDIAQWLPELAADLRSLEKLAALDVPSALNKIRYIAEKVLHGLCTSGNVSWGQAEPTLERMLGPLVAAGLIPKSAAMYLRIVQLVASPGSHFQESELTAAHLEIGVLGLIGFLQWHSDNRPAASTAAAPPPPLLWPS